MRILQIGYLPLEKGGESAGGIATHIWELSEALRNAGHHPEILAQNIRVGDFTVEGIPVRPFASERDAILLPLKQKPSIKIFVAAGVARGRWLKGVGKAYWVKKILEAARPDLIHSHIPSFFFVPVARALGYRGPVVLTVHSVHDLIYTGADPEGLARMRALFQDSMRLSDAMIAVHPHVLDEARDLGLSWETPGRVIINAVNPKIFGMMPRDKAKKSLGLPADERIILFSGIMTGRKGEKELIKAFSLLKEDARLGMEGTPRLITRDGARVILRGGGRIIIRGDASMETGENARLVMIGYGPREPEARALIRELGLSERITLTGPVPRERMSLYYNAADLFVLPSHSEGFALSYMEAMLCGTPFLADRNIPTELVSPDNCVLVDSRDPADIARGITDAMGKQWDRERIADFGRRFAWGPEKLSEYLEVYEEARRAAEKKEN